MVISYTFAAIYNLFQNIDKQITDVRKRNSYGRNIVYVYT